MPHLVAWVFVSLRHRPHDSEGLLRVGFVAAFLTVSGGDLSLLTPLGAHGTQPRA